MNTVYDLLLNFQDKIYDFYEWSLDDKIDHIKKISFIKVETSVLKDIYLKDIRVDSRILKKIEDTTLRYDLSKIKYCCVFTDGITSLAVVFDDDGNIVKRSKLQLEDEDEILRYSKRFNFSEVEYEIVGDRDNYLFLTRREEMIKDFLTLEIDKIYQNKEFSKLEYIYLEYFDKLDDNREVMKNKLLDFINKEIDERCIYIYNLLHLSVKEGKLSK